jgi:hypothetical protein
MMSRAGTLRGWRCCLGLGFGLIALLAPSLGIAQTKPILKLQSPTAPVRLLVADCLTNCWLSGLFAPGVIRDRTAALPVTNVSTVPVRIDAELVPTNGLALEHLGGHLTLEHAGKSVLGQSLDLGVGETAQLKLAFALGEGLPAGAYAMQLQFVATARDGNADPQAQAVAVDLRVRASAFWAVLAVLAGILVGRLAQLVYDPKLIARVQLLDWLHALRDRIERLTDEGLAAGLMTDLMDLMRRLAGRGIEAAALQPEVAQLELRIDQAERAPVPAAALEAMRRRTAQHDMGQPASPSPGLLGWLKRVLRVLAGITPLPLPSVYDWLLPLLVLVTLAALTIVFVIQQYGGGGTAETFGAGGLADYAALFLAGVASDAIAGGLRSIKLAAPAR